MIKGIKMRLFIKTDNGLLRSERAAIITYNLLVVPTIKKNGIQKLVIISTKKGSNHYRLLP